MEGKTRVLREEEVKNEKGYQLIIRNLDTGEEVVNATTNCIIGAYAEKTSVKGIASSNGIVITACSPSELIGAIETCESGIKKMKERIIDDVTRKLLGEIRYGEDDDE